MISEEKVEMYCCEDASKIENYDKAIADNAQIWVIHHRAEILPCGRFSSKDLKRFRLYYNQPADRLIFLPVSEHSRLHAKGVRLSEEHKRRIAKANTGKKHSEETKRLLSELAKQRKGFYWWTNETDNVKAKVCPTGFRRGRTMHNGTERLI